MEQQYKIGIFGRLFYGLCASGLVIFFTFLMFSKSQENKAIYLFPLLMILLCVLVLINLFKSKVIITSNSITRERVFYSKTLNFEDIKGCRIGSKLIVIEPIDALTSNLRISNYSDFANYEILTDWIRGKFIDLDKIDLERENEELLHDTTLGSTENEREEKLSKARQVAIAYTVWGFIMFFVLLWIRNSYASLLVGVLYPILGIIIMKFSFGLIKFLNNSQKSIYSGIGIGFCMPILILFITSIAEYEVLSFTKALPIATVIAIILFVLLYNVGINKTTGSITGQIVFILIISSLFGFGSTVVTNCLFDKSVPTEFKTTVVDEYISSGKGAHYHLKLNPWKSDQNVREIDVSESTYEKTPIGSPVIIEEKKGFFNIPWFDFKIDPTPPAPADLNNGSYPIPR
jgi:hypothetical protein